MRTSTRNLDSEAELPVFVLSRGVLLPYGVRPVRAEESKVEWLQTAARSRQVLVVPSPPTCHESTVLGDRQAEPSGNSGEYGCLAQVTTCEERSSECLLILRGLCRTQLIQRKGDRSRFRLQPDVYARPAKANRQHLRDRLLTNLYQKVPRFAHKQFLSAVLNLELPLGTLCDLIADVLTLSEEEAAVMLRENCIDRRCQFVIERLHDLQLNPDSFRFPPRFSGN